MKRAINSVWVGLFALSISLPVWAKGAYTESELRTVETADEAKVRDLRNQEITQLRIALGRRLPPNRRADLYFRLAEIYVEAYRTGFILEGRVHEKRLEKGLTDKFIDRSYSKPNLYAAIKACQEILKFKIPYSKLDEVYYFLGFNYGELGKRKESIRNFEILVRNYPKSQFAGEGYRELGDVAFQDNQYSKAIVAYESAAKLSSVEMRPRILHRLAWSYYRTRQFERAITTMKEAVAVATKSGEKLLSLQEEALRDMAVFLTETGKVDEAIRYFQTVADKSFYPRILEKLGKQYERTLEPVKATQVYESLLKTHPESDAAFRVLVKLVDLDLRRGRYPEALGRLHNLRLPEGGDVETQTSTQNLRAMIRRTATEHHEEYRRKHARADLEIAESYYTQYLKTFLSKDDPRKETPEIQMYLAEVKRDVGKSKEASELYRQVVDSRDKRYAKEAGALWTASLAEAIKKAPPNKSGELSSLEKEYIDAADRLQEALGGTPEGREAALKSAQVLAGYKDSQKNAVKRIRKIISEWPKTPQALIAAKLWVQILTDDEERVDDLKEALKELQGNSELLAADKESNGGKLKMIVADQDLRLKIGAIAKEEKDKDFADAGKGYEGVAAESTQRDFAEKAYANAIGSYLKANEGRSTEAVDRVISTWLKRFPKSPKAGESIRAAATHYLIKGQYESAAKLFERVGRDGDQDSLETAARLYEGYGDVTRAQAVWVSYLELFPKSPNRSSVAFALAKSQDAAHLDTEAGKAYQYCMSGSQEFEAVCGAKLAELYLRNKDMVQAKAMFKRVASQTVRRKGDSLSPYVAYARFRLAEFAEEDMKFDPLQLPEARLKKALNQRMDFVESLSRAYKPAMEAGGPWGVAALFRLALWVKKFADEVDHIPTPPSATPQSVAKFRKNLESVSGLLRKKAIATWSEGYAKAVASETLSPMLPELADYLADSRLPVPGRAQGPRGVFRISGIPADGGSDGRSTALQKVRDKLLKNPQDAAAWVDYGNLLWGESKLLLAKIAYDRALGLNPNLSSALNNRGVVEISGDRQDDWISAAEGAQMFQDALKHDSFFLPAKFNRASLFNYYRIFAKAKPLWEQVLTKDSSADARDGLAIAKQGLGELADLSAAESLFVRVYHDVGKSLGKTTSLHEGAGFCLSKLGELDGATLGGFEKLSVERLKGSCALWKNEK